MCALVCVCAAGATTKPAGTGPAAVPGGVDARDPAWVKTVPAATTGSGLANPQFRKAATVSSPPAAAGTAAAPLAQVKAAVVHSPPPAAATTSRKARQN